MKKLIIFIFIAVLWQNANADQIYLTCSGVEKVLIGENFYAPKSQSDLKSFELVITTKSPQMYGYPTMIAPGCFDKSSIENQMDETKTSCSINDVAIDCSCDNLLASSKLRLSRRTSVFEITNVYKKSNTTISGKYSCVKSNSKVF